MKATKQYFLVVQFNTLYNVVLSYASVDKIMKSDHSNCRLRAVSLFSWSVGQNARDTQMTTRVTEGARRERPLPPSPKVWSFSCKLLSSTLLWYCFFVVRWERQNARKGLNGARLFAALPFVKARFKAVFRFACAVAIVDSLSLPNLPNSTEIKVLNDGAK